MTTPMTKHRPGRAPALVSQPRCNPTVSPFGRRPAMWSIRIKARKIGPDDNRVRLFPPSAAIYRSSILDRGIAWGVVPSTTDTPSEQPARLKILKIDDFLKQYGRGNSTSTFISDSIGISHCLIFFRPESIDLHGPLAIYRKDRLRVLVTGVSLPTQRLVGEFVRLD